MLTIRLKADFGNYVPGSIVQVGEEGIAGGVADVLVRRGIAEYVTNVESMAVKTSKETAVKKLNRSYKDGIAQANNGSD